jgi:hypothetical protein
MKEEQQQISLDGRMQQAVAELQALIGQRYPDASFSLAHPEDEPTSVEMTAVVDVDDPDEVLGVPRRATPARPSTASQPAAPGKTAATRPVARFASAAPSTRPAICRTQPSTANSSRSRPIIRSYARSPSA